MFEKLFCGALVALDAFAAVMVLSPISTLLAGAAVVCVAAGALAWPALAMMEAFA